MKTRTLLKLLRVISKGCSDEEIRNIAACQIEVIRIRKSVAVRKTRERKKLLRQKKSL